MLTTSEDETDIVRFYDLGVSAFSTKPETFAGQVEVMKAFGKYWIDIVAVPQFDEDGFNS